MTPHERGIIHLNFSSFMASVEESSSPELKGVPFVIADPQKSRAIVLDMSPKAWAEGIRKGMPLRIAKKIVRPLTVVPPNATLYSTASSRISEISGHYSPFTEVRSGGHIFIDISGTRRLFGHMQDTAARIKNKCQKQLGLDPATSVSGNKTVSKVASRVVSPRGFASIPNGDESSFMYPQSISLLPGIGQKMSERLTAYGINIMGDLSEINPSHLTRVFGKVSLRLRDRSMGIDNDPVFWKPASELSISSSFILSDDTNDPCKLNTVLLILAEDAGLTLRSSCLSTRKVILNTLYSDGQTFSISRTLSTSIFSDAEIYTSSLPLLEKARMRRIRIREMTIVLREIADSLFQMNLFEPQPGKLQQTLDRLRTDSGVRILQRASRLQLEQQ
ncbi:MAG: hypothetical protein JXR95_01255 [Deltaproteobacteria bacterium]|nr:hypothetical protein [Deltaproteobacteria bacterium]